MSQLQILDASGRPYQMPSRQLAEAEDGEATLKFISTFATATAGLQAPALQQMRDPYGNSAWVYAAAVAIGLNASQAPFTVFREDDDAQALRVTALKKRGLPWRGAFPCGTERQAFRRHSSYRGRAWGFRQKGVEEDFDHPLVPILESPNPTMSGTQLWFLTHIWMATKGEAFWLLLDENGEPCSWKENRKIRSIWPVAPDLFREIIWQNVLVGWSMVVDRGRGFGSPGRMITIAPDEIIQFKRPDPNNLLRGLPSISAAAQSIMTDFTIAKLEYGTVKGGGPLGVLVHKPGVGGGKNFKDKKEEEEFRAWWNEQYQNTDRPRSVALLSGDWQFVPVGVVPKDMDFLNSRKWSRESILAVMGVPGSILAITDRVNFATQLAQDRNFWDKNLLPALKSYEATLDATLFWSEPDTTYGAFDTSKVEALKVGVADKINAANVACGPNLHMPPKEAFDVVGLDVPPYDGDDISVFPANMETLEAVLQGPQTPAATPGAAKPTEPPAPGAPKPTAPPKPPKAEGSIPTPKTGRDNPETTAPPPESQQTRLPSLTAGMRLDIDYLLDYNSASNSRHSNTSQGITKQSKTKRWHDLMKVVQAPYEQKFRQAWRKFVAGQRKIVLQKLAKLATGKGLLSVIRDVDPVEASLNLDDMREALISEFDPIYRDELESVFEYTAEDLGGGVISFHLDDPDIVSALDDREDMIAGSAPETLQNALRQSLREGIESAETVQQLRARVANVMDLASSSAKTLSIARTESSGFMNDVREAMFDKGGFEKRVWVTAGDERVRPNHRRFGRAGPVKSGFNYLTLVGEDGVLGYPGDPDAPAGEVINCRCVHVPA